MAEDTQSDETLYDYSIGTQEELAQRAEELAGQGMCSSRHEAFRLLDRNEFYCGSILASELKSVQFLLEEEEEANLSWLNYKTISLHCDGTRLLHSNSESTE